MEGALILDWVFRLLSWTIMAGVGWVMIALYVAMRVKGNVRMAEVYWWFLTVQAVVIFYLSGIRVFEGLASARLLFVFALIATVALIWARVTRPMAPTSIGGDFDDDFEPS